MNKRRFLTRSIGALAVLVAAPSAYFATRKPVIVEPLLSDPEGEAYGYDKNGWIVARQ